MGNNNTLDTPINNNTGKSPVKQEERFVKKKRNSMKFYCSIKTIENKQEFFSLFLAPQIHLRDK
jgi:hypothetical protein